MNNLEIIDFNGKKVIDSRVVAERIEIQHKDLLKKVRNYEEILLSAKLRSVDFFIPSEYKDSTGRKLTCYLLTKQGCEMVANKLTGEKGVLFTAEYVQAFNAMEEQTKQKLPSSPMELLELQLHALKEVDQKVADVQGHLEDHEKNHELTRAEYDHLSAKVSARIKQVKQVREWSLNKAQCGALKHGINGDICRYMGVRTRTMIARKDFEKACLFVEGWDPSSVTLSEIKALEVRNEEI